MAYGQEDYQNILRGLNTPTPGTYTPAANAANRAAVDAASGHPSQHYQEPTTMFDVAATTMSHTELQAMQRLALQQDALKRRHGLTGPAKHIVEADYWKPISQGIINKDGSKAEDWLGSAREYWASNGHEGSWAEAMGGVATPDSVVARGRLAPVETDYADQFRSTETRVAWLATHVPGAVVALTRSGLKPQDVATVHNVFVAKSAADRAMALLEEGPNGQLEAAQLIGALPLQTRIIAAAMLDDENKRQAAEARAAYDRYQEESRQEAADFAADNPAAANLAPTASRGAPGSARGVSQGDTSYDVSSNPLSILLDATLFGVETLTRNANAMVNTYASVTDYATGDDKSAGGFVDAFRGRFEVAGGPAFEDMDAGQRWSAWWDASAPNTMLQSKYDEGVERFGKADLDEMIRFYEATRSEDPQAMAEYYASIDGNVAAQAMITSAMRGENVGGNTNDAAEMFAFVAGSDNGNFGNVMAGGLLGMDPDNAAFSATRDVSNVASWFAFDPLTYTFGLGKMLRASKYGLDAAVVAGNGSFTRGMANLLRSETLGGNLVSKVPGLNRNGIRIIHDDFGQAVKEWANAETAAAKAVAYNKIQKRFFKGDNTMFTPQDAKLAKEKGLFSAEKWARHYDEIADAEDIIKGKPVALKPAVGGKQGMEYLDQFSAKTRAREAATAQREAKNTAMEGATGALGRLDGQQVGRKLYVPHTTIARTAVGDVFARATGNIVSEKKFDKTMAKLERALGPEFAAASPDEQMAVLIEKVGGDEDIARAFGVEFSRFRNADGEMKRSWLGNRIDSVFDRNDATRAWGARLGLYKKVVLDGNETASIHKVKGWQKRHGWQAMKAGAARIFGRLPNTPHGIDVVSANDAQEVYRMVVAAGMGKDVARIIRAAWAQSDLAARENMMIGLVRSFTQAMGISAIDDKAEARILEQITGIGAKELYATDQIRRYAGVWQDLRKETREAANAKKKGYAEAEYLDIDGRVAEIELRLNGRGVAFADDDIEAALAFQKDVDTLQAEVKDLRKQLASGEKGLSKTAAAKERKRALDEWWDRPVTDESGIYGKTTNGQLLERLFETGMGRSPSKFEQAQLRKGMLPRAFADKYRKGKTGEAVGSDDAWNLFNSPTGVLDNISPNPEWQGVYESAEKVGRTYYIEVPWARKDIQRVMDDAVDQAIAPDEYLDDLARQIESREADISMAQGWLDENPDLVRAANEGGQLSKAEVKALNAERRSLLKERDKRIRDLVNSVDEESMLERAVRLEKKKGGRLNPDTHYNPSVAPNGKPSALYPGQTADRMAVPNFQALDRYAARASFVSALMFNNKAGSAVTEMWVLGTLAGPRFQLRNGTEDIGMYALTGGRFGSFFRGRKLGQAIDSAMARVDADVIAARARVRNLEREVTLAKAANAKGGIGKGDNAVKAAEDRLDSAVKDLNKRLETRDLYGRQKYGDHQKLGSVRTIAVNLSERATYIPGTDRVRDGLVSRMAQFLVPTTSSFERAQAARLGRDAVADLAARAVMRQKLVFNRNGLGKLIPRRARSLDDLSPKQRQYMQWEDDLLRSKYGLQFKDDAAESAKHYADGGIPVERSSNNYVFDTDGNVMVKVPLSRGYASQGLSDNVLDEHAARAMAARLRFMSDKYGLNQAAMHQVPDYWKAVTANDVQKVDAVVDNVLAWARSSSDWPYLAERFRLSDNLGAREHVRRMLDDMADAFTTRRGNWNQDLWRAMRHTDEKGKVYFTTEGVNGAESLVDEMAFMQGKFETPMSVLVHEGDDHFLMPLKNGVSSAMWSSMGRSLARMTRNPIWYGNYVTARGQMSAMEKHYASVFGETYARQLFTEAAAERAYHLTMSWVDNPSIRTNLSWQVRNVARYYRAQEDFARRLIRMGKYDPVSIQKANLAWQAQQDFGFTYQDQYGDDYFMYPGSAAVMGVVQNVFGGLGLGGMKYGAAPMAFGGKVTWLSPSLDPQSWLPTVSSPWMALTLQPLLRTMPGVDSLFHDIERIAFGETASNMDYADMGMGDSILGDLAGGFYQTLPPVMKRLFAANPIVNANDRPGSYGYKMTAKTLMAMASAGRIPEGEEWLDPNKRRKFLEEMEQRTFEVAGLSAIFGLFAPASPQYQEDNVSLAAREAGYQALNPAFREMVQASLDSGKDYMEATVSWMQHNPNDNIFFVGLTETIGGPAVAATEKNVEFLASHEELFRKNDTAAAFFTPEGQEAGTDQAALRSLKYFDLRRYRELSDVLMDLGSAEGRMEAMMVAQGLKEARRNTPQFDAEGNKTPEWEMLEQTESQANIILDTMYPTRDAGLGEWMEKDEAEFAVEAQKVVDAARELAAEGNTYGMYVLPLADLYVQFKREFDDFQNSPHGDNYAEEKATMGDIWAESVNAWWSIYGPKGYPRDRAEKLESLFTNSINKGWAQKVAIPADEEQ